MSKEKSLGFAIEPRAGVMVLLWDDDGGCQPASPAEIALWNRLHSTPTTASVPVVEREALRQALSDLLAQVDRDTCIHENTHRGGSIWTICDECGRKWSDDRDPFVPHADSPAVAAARAALSSYPAPVQTEVRADGETVRVDRWQVGIRRIVALLWGNRHEFEVDEVVEAVRALIPSPKDDEDSLVQAVLDRPAPVQGEQDKEHAENYRWLRDAANVDERLYVTEQRCNDWGKWFTARIQGKELDAAIRAARSTGGQT